MAHLEDMTVEKETLGPFTLRVVADDSGIGNPRENSNLGVLVSWDRDGFGDEHVRDTDSYGTLRNLLVASFDALAETILPVQYVDYGSGGSRFSVVNDWDRANGAIFATPATVAECGTPPDRIEECLRGEIKEYGQWANGEVYGWVIEKDGAVLDSVWGYIGDTEYPMSEARATAEYLPEYRREVIGAFAGSEGLGL